MLINSAKNILAAVLLLVCVQVQAQQAYQRFFTSDDRVILNLGVEPSLGGGFYSLNASIDPESSSTDVNMLLVTKHDPKGNVIWANEYTLKDESFITNLKTIDIATLDKDTLMITGSSVDFSLGGAALVDENFIFKISPQTGNLLFSNEISSLEDALLPISFPYGINGYDSNYNYFANHNNGDTLGIQHIVYDASDTVLSSRAYFLEDSDPSTTLNALTDVRNTVDSNYILSFIADAFSTKNVVTTIDPLGNVIQGNEYTVNPDSLSSFIMQTIAIESTPDTGVVQTGFVVDQLTNNIFNYVIKTDSSGNIQWSKIIDGSILGFISQVNDISYSSMNEIVVSGKYANIGSQTQGDFAVFFNEEGQVVRQWDYNSDNSIFLIFNPNGTFTQFINGELENMNDGGMIYGTVGIEPSSGVLSPYFIKTDALGNAFCQDTLDLELVKDYEFLMRPVSMISSDFATVDTFTLERRNYGGFTAPVLTLLDTVFCPQDPIMVTLDATQEGASSYEWSTGETTPTLDVMEEGDYSVTVTIEDKVCYMLCDTSSITRRDFPNATIDAIAIGLCQVDSILLSANSNNQITDIRWSTGDSISSIYVYPPDTYSVTVTDICGNEASAELNTANISLPETPELTVDILQEGECESLTLIAQVIPGTSIGNVSFEWSNGSQSAILSNIQSSGTYVVSVTDFCGRIGTAEVTLEDDIDFADVFFPGGRANHTENSKWGPYIKCPDFFKGDNFSLQMYNRFGNKVYESDDVTDKWDGFFGGELAPSDVYMYQYSYDLEDGSSVKGKGHVTLLRQ